MDISRLEVVMEIATGLSAKIAHDGASNGPNESEVQQSAGHWEEPRESPARIIAYI
jgi:hypothetical protein